MGEDKREIKKEITEEILSILKNGSSRVEIMELLKLGADSIKNSTYRTLLDGDLEYAQIKAQVQRKQKFYFSYFHLSSLPIDHQDSPYICEPHSSIPTATRQTNSRRTRHLLYLFQN